MLTKSARYIGTALKQLSLIVDKELRSVKVTKMQKTLFANLYAAVNYLQSEFASALVSSTCDDKTTYSCSRVWRRTTLHLMNRSLQNLRNATVISAATGRMNQSQRDNNHGSRMQGRGRGDYGYGNYGRFHNPWQGRRFPQRDMFNNHGQSTCAAS